ncbi:hypothetical protein EMCRGX_G029047 [Ephydatia muelleri]
MRIRSSLAFLLAITTYVAGWPMEDGRTMYERKLKEIACALERNQTLRAAFQKDVKLQYGMDQNLNSTSRARVEITEFPTSPMTFVLGQTISVKCSATASSSISYIRWAQGFTALNPIREDPYCTAINGCAVDTAAGSAKLERVRAYAVYKTSSLCGEDQMNMTSYLVIENATEADAGNYTCSAETLMLFPNVKESASLFLGVR